MNKEEALKLINKYTEGTVTPDEKILVEQYLQAYIETNTQLPDHLSIEKANKDIWNHLQNHIYGVPKSSGVWRLSRLAIAASLLIAVSLGLFFGLSYFNEHNNRVLVLNAIDVLPGKNTAILTMNDGRAIQLSEEKSGIVIGAADLKYNDNSNVGSENESVDLNKTLTVTTPRGGTYKITLHDGTHVWLNAGSSLKFPAHFGGSEKRVELTGEAYFEVARLAVHPKPFIVSTTKQEVEVLGTHFNVNGYGDEPSTITTLLEGSVRVSAIPDQKDGNLKMVTATLTPNQQSVLNRGGIRVAQVNAEGVAAWTEGYFDFNEEKLEHIMNKIARWYDVRVFYEDPALKEQIFTGNISRFTKVSEVLKKLALSKVVRFKIDGKKIIVTD